MIENPEFWIAVAFVIVVAALVWKGGPMLTDMLDQRAEAIKGELDEAQRLREEASRMLAEFQRRQRDALKEAEEIVAHARVEAERESERAEAALIAALERRRQMAAQKIALEEQKALLEVRNQAVEIAIAAVRRAFAEGLDPARRTQLMDQAIAELPRALH
jgi:F-type H+-transporting ATPase subunit b